LVFDTLGKDIQEKSFKVLKKGGMMVSIVQSPDAKLARKVQANTGFVFVKPNGKELAEITKLLEAGKLKPVIDKIYPFDQIKDAHTYSETGHAKGKIIIRIR